MNTAKPFDFNHFLAPRGVVIVGASADPGKLGYAQARNLVESGYRGAIHFVNPKGGTLFGQPVYVSVAEVPDPVELAVLLVPAPAIPPALRECGQRGIPAALILAGGFRETSAEGAALEAECVRIAAEYGMRFIGPNSVGLLNTYLPMDATFLPPPHPMQGDVALLSHSGAMCLVVIGWALEHGFGFSRLISLGNQANVSETDMLAVVADDAQTAVVTMYLEGVSDGRRFVDEASRVARQKPVVALKVGRFASGRRAAASHTGALAGQDSAYEAAFRRCGVIRANTMQELFDWARSLAHSPLPQGRSIAILTNAGGPGVAASDALEANGLRLADLSEETRTALRSLLISAASVNNPVDMLAGASPHQYATSLQILLADPGVDGVIVIFPSSPIYSDVDVADALIPVIQASSKPVLTALLGGIRVKGAVERFRAAHLPDFELPEWAAVAMSVLLQRAEFLGRAAQTPLRPIAAKPSFSGDIHQLLAAYGIPTAAVELATSAETAAAIANRMGYPVALKVASPDISHKSDVGGVLLGLDNPQAVVQGYDTVIANARAARPGAHIEGVHVQRMIPPGQEVIVGVVRDPQFGPLAMFGSGGVEVEGLKDVAFALAPLTAADADYLLDNTWAGRKLRGFRNLPPADRQAVREVLVRLGQLAEDFPEISEIEINPLRVLADGQGVFAVDVRAG